MDCSIGFVAKPTLYVSVQCNRMHHRHPHPKLCWYILLYWCHTKAKCACQCANSVLISHQSKAPLCMQADDGYFSYTAIATTCFACIPVHPARKASSRFPCFQHTLQYAELALPAWQENDTEKFAQYFAALQRHARHLSWPKALSITEHCGPWYNQCWQWKSASEVWCSCFFTKTSQLFVTYVPVSYTCSTKKDKSNVQPICRQAAVKLHVKSALCGLPEHLIFVCQSRQHTQTWACSALEQDFGYQFPCHHHCRSETKQKSLL